MKYPLKSVFITQKWGENPEVYKRFGLQGHNGLDLRAKTGTEVYAPHDGIVKERRFDKEGYGNYLKIENDKEGSVLAHLKDFAVGIGKAVKEGDLAGHADSTGFSTASHLHWGYYRIPRNRNDGYLGYINQETLINQTPDEELKECLHLLHDVVIPEKEGLQREYDAFKKTAAERIKSRDDTVADREQGIRAAETDREQTAKVLKTLKEEDFNRVQSLAQKLLARPDWPGITAEIDRLLVVEDQKSAIEKQLYTANEKIKGMEIALTTAECLTEGSSVAGVPIIASEFIKRGGGLWQKILKALNGLLTKKT